MQKLLYLSLKKSIWYMFLYFCYVFFKKLNILYSFYIRTIFLPFSYFYAQFLKHIFKKYVKIILTIMSSSYHIIIVFCIYSVYCFAFRFGELLFSCFISLKLWSHNWVNWRLINNSKGRFSWINGAKDVNYFLSKFGFSSRTWTSMTKDKSLIVQFLSYIKQKMVQIICIR